MIFLELFISYLKIGFFSFGGGYAMLPLLQNEIVAKQGWIDMTQFADIVAISQMTPGPIAINSATYVGYTVGLQAGGTWAGILGSLVATIAVSAPAMSVMLLITRYFLKLKGHPAVIGMMKGMRPVVLGMIAAAALMLIYMPDAPREAQNFIDPWSWLIFGAVGFASYKKVSPILLIVGSAVAGIAIYYIPTLF